MPATPENRININPPLDAKGVIPTVIINEGLIGYSLATNRPAKRSTLTNILLGSGYTQQQIKETKINNFGLASRKALTVAREIGVDSKWQPPRVSETPDSMHTDNEVTLLNGTLTKEGLIPQATIFHLMVNMAGGSKRTGHGARLSRSRIKRNLQRYGVPRHIINETLETYSNRRWQALTAEANRTSSRNGKRGTPRKRQTAEIPPSPITPSVSLRTIRLTSLSFGTPSELVYSKSTGDDDHSSTGKPDVHKVVSSSAAKSISYQGDVLSHEGQTHVKNTTARQIWPRPTPEATKSIIATGVSEADGSEHTIDMHIRRHKGKMHGTISTPNGSIPLSPLETRLVLALKDHNGTYTRASLIAEQIGISAGTLGDRLQSMRLKLEKEFPFPVLQRIRRSNNKNSSGKRTTTSRHRINPGVQIKVIE